MLPEISKAPVLPPIGECSCTSEQIIKLMKGNINVAKRVEFFTDVNTNLFSPESDSSTPLLEGWIQFADKRPHDMFSSLFFLDCLPPPVMNVVFAPWFPTLEYTVHFWANPAEHDIHFGDLQKALRCRFSSDHIENGSFHTDGELWSHDGNVLLAKSRQLARIITSGKS